MRKVYLVSYQETMVDYEYGDHEEIDSRYVIANNKLEVIKYYDQYSKISLLAISEIADYVEDDKSLEELVGDHLDLQEEMEEDDEDEE